MTDQTRENLSGGVICGTIGATIGEYLQLILGLSYLASIAVAGCATLFLLIPLWNYLVAKFAHKNTP